MITGITAFDYGLVAVRQGVDDDMLINNASHLRFTQQTVCRHLFTPAVQVKAERSAAHVNMLPKLGLLNLQRSGSSSQQP